MTDRPRMITSDYVRALEDLYFALIAKAPYDHETQRYMGELAPELTAVKVLRQARNLSDLDP